MNAICAQVLDLAKRQIGYKEEYINCTKYSRFFDVEAWQWFNTKKNGNPAKKVAGTKWCALFICWLFAQNETLGQKQALSFLGCPAPKNNAAAGCGFLYDYMKAKGYKSDIKNVKPGDIVFFKSKKGECEHVGICLDVDGNNIHTIEGNKEDQVKKCHHYKNSDIYFGVMSPDWDKAHFYEKKEEPEVPAAKPEAPAAPAEELKEGDILIVSIKYNSSYLSLRAYASTSAPTLKKMKKGTKVTYLGKRSGSWLMVKCGNVIGWACQHESGKDYDYLTKV